MMTIEVQYQQLREEFIAISKIHITSEILEQIKNTYTYEINSKRQISSIKDLRKLIQVLEKRDVLNYDDIKVFHYIQKTYINVPDLEHKLKDYEDRFKSLNSTPNCNMYLYDNANSSTNRNQQTYGITNSLEDTRNTSNVNQVPERLQTRTCKTVSDLNNYKIIKLQETVILKIYENLGRSWKNVCRYMGLKEYQIDEIQNRYPYNLKEQSFQGLHICISQNDPEWKINLLNALEKSRRKDIKEIVEEVLLC